MIIIDIFTLIRCGCKRFFYKLVFGKRFKFGYKLRFRKSFNIIVKKSGNLVIGDNCFFNNYCSINCLDKINIGDNCIFGEAVKIYDHNHCYRERTKLISHQGYRKDSITIGNNCWIGSNTVILKGVSLGNNVIIGANCTIYKDVPDNTVVVNEGNTIYKNIQYNK